LNIRYKRQIYQIAESNKKNRFGSKNRIGTFFARIGMLYTRVVVVANGRGFYINCMRQWVCGCIDCCDTSHTHTHAARGKRLQAWTRRKTVRVQNWKLIRTTSCLTCLSVEPIITGIDLMCFPGSGPTYFFSSWVRIGIGSTHFLR